MEDEPPAWMQKALARIAWQEALVARLEPGSHAHQLATSVLLVLQDSLHVMLEAHELMARLGRLPRI